MLLNFLGSDFIFQFITWAKNAICCGFLHRKKKTIILYSFLSFIFITKIPFEFERIFVKDPSISVGMLEHSLNYPILMCFSFIHALLNFNNENLLNFHPSF